LSKVAFIPLLKKVPSVS